MERNLSYFSIVFNNISFIGTAAVLDAAISNYTIN